MEERRKYPMDQLIPVVTELVTRLKDAGEDAKIPEDFLQNHPWAQSVPRKGNLRKLAKTERLIVDFLNCDPVTESSLPRQLKIRVSEVDIRHRRDGAHTDILSFQEVELGEFIYLPK